MPLAASHSLFFRCLQTLSGAVTRVIFPGGCRLCDQFLPDARRFPLCDDCLSSFERLPGEACEVCGAPGSLAKEITQGRALCPDCRQQRFAFHFARSFGVYEGRLSLSENGFARRLAEIVRRECDSLAADMVVPVPLHRLRQRKRGFNQVDLFGRPLARLLKLPYGPVLLTRARPRPEKHPAPQ
jgi:predicted amidophosphoribosyltransferase